jgi:hypothetical protein
MPDKEITSFAEFWPYYVCEHSKSGTRVLHLIGTTTGIALLLLLILSARWWMFPLALVPGYGFAWVGHFFVEHNRPATFKYPIWSFMGDYKMVAMMLAGKMDRELARASLATPSA